MGTATVYGPYPAGSVTAIQDGLDNNIASTAEIAVHEFNGNVFFTVIADV